MASETEHLQLNENSALNDFAVMLSLYTKLISSPKIKEITLQEIKDFFDGRMVYRKEYF